MKELLRNIIAHTGGQYTKGYSTDKMREDSFPDALPRVAYSGPIDGPIPDSLLERHLTRGLDFFLGVSIHANDRARCTVFDFDCKGPSEVADCEARYAKARAAFDADGVPYTVFKSGSGYGYHIWIFFDEALPLSLVRVFNAHYVDVIGYPDLETFPMREGGRNNVALPLGRRSEHLRGTVIPFDIDAWKPALVGHSKTLKDVLLKEGHVYGGMIAVPGIGQTVLPVLLIHLSFVEGNRLWSFRYRKEASRADVLRGKAKKEFPDREHMPHKDMPFPKFFEGRCWPAHAVDGILEYYYPVETVTEEARTKPGRKTNAAQVDYNKAFECAATTYDVNVRDKGWTAFAMALKAAFAGTEHEDWARNSWIEWSRGYDKWDDSTSPNWCEEWWNHKDNKEKKNGPYTFWSRARAGGYTGKSPYSKKDEEKRGALSIIQEKCTVFRSRKTGDYFADCGNRRVYQANGSEFAKIVRRMVFEETGDSISVDMLKNAIETSIALCDAWRDDVYLRFANHGGKSYLFMGDDDWRVIEIDAEGWRFCELPPVSFVKVATTKPLPEPEDGFTIADFDRYFNFTDDAKLFSLSWVVKNIIGSDSVTPGFAFHGEKGSAKSFGMERLVSLADPRAAIICAPPKDETDLIISGMNSAIVTFDNVTATAALTDGMTRCVSGSGLKTRLYFTNGEQFTVEIMRPIAYTTIVPSLNKSDIIERFVFIEMYRIKEFKKDEVVRAEYAAAHGKLFKVVLDLCVETLKRKDAVPEPTIARCASYAHIGEVVASIIKSDYQPGDFSAMYEEQLEDAQDSASEGDLTYRMIKDRLLDFKQQDLKECEVDPVAWLDQFQKIKRAQELTGFLPDTVQGLKVKFGYIAEQLHKDTGYKLVRRRVGKRRVWFAVSAEGGAGAFEGFDVAPYAE